MGGAIHRGLTGIGIALVSGACMAGWSATPVQAEVVESIRLTSSPSGSKVYQLSAGHQTQVCDATPCDWQAEFHSEQSVLRLRFELPGHEGVTEEVTSKNRSVAVSLKMTNAAAAAYAAKSPHLRALETRLTPAIREAVRAASATASKIAQSSDPPDLREIGGHVYVWLPLLVRNLKSEADAGDANMVDSMWSRAGAGFEEALRNRLASEDIAGLIVEATPAEPGRDFAVSSQMESTTEITCIPGTIMRYDNCASRAPDYTYRCYNGNCTSFESGSHCVGGQVAQYSACATRGPITRYQVKVDPQIAIKSTNTSRVRLIAICDWSGKTESTLIQTDAAGHVSHVEGPEPSAAIKQAIGLSWN